MSNENQGGGGMPDLGGIMELAQKLQGDVVKMQEELAELKVEGSAGGGMVTATVNGNYEMVALKIDPEVIDPAEQGMLQDLIVAACNQAISKMRETAKDQMSKVAGGLNIPGMPPNFKL